MMTNITQNMNLNINDGKLNVPQRTLSNARFEEHKYSKYVHNESLLLHNKHFQTLDLMKTECSKHEWKLNVS